MRVIVDVRIEGRGKTHLTIQRNEVHEVISERGLDLLRERLAGLYVPDVPPSEQRPGHGLTETRDEDGTVHWRIRG